MYHHAFDVHFGGSVVCASQDIDGHKAHMGYLAFEIDSYG
jgi:hypothetical protein